MTGLERLLITATTVLVFTVLIMHSHYRGVAAQEQDCPPCPECPILHDRHGHRLETVPITICKDGEMVAMVPYGDEYEVVELGVPCQQEAVQ